MLPKQLKVSDAARTSLFLPLFRLVEGHFLLVGNNTFCVHKVSMCYDLCWWVMGLLISAKRSSIQPINPTQSHAVTLLDWWWGTNQPSMQPLYLNGDGTHIAPPHIATLLEWWSGSIQPSMQFPTQPHPSSLLANLLE